MMLTAGATTTLILRARRGSAFDRRLRVSFTRRRHLVSGAPTMNVAVRFGAAPPSRSRCRADAVVLRPDSPATPRRRRRPCGYARGWLSLAMAVQRLAGLSALPPQPLELLRRDRFDGWFIIEGSCRKSRCGDYAAPVLIDVDRPWSPESLASRTSASEAAATKV